MRKGWLVLLSLVLVAAFAVPAMALEFKFNGFIRIKPTMSNYHFYGPTAFSKPGNEAAVSFGTSSPDTTSIASLIKEDPSGGGFAARDTNTTASYVEQRNRLRFEIGDENVKGVTFFEIDGAWGDIGGKVGRNQGFASNGDSINIETKQAFLWFKIPDTNWSFTAGLQGYTDEFAGIIFGASDQAGIVANWKYEPVNFRLTWLKLRKHADFAIPQMNGSAGSVVGVDTFNSPAVNPVAQGFDIFPGDEQADYYAVDAKFSPAKDVALTGHFGFIRDNGSFNSEPSEANAGDANKLMAYYLGLNGTVKLAPVTLTGFFLYNFGTFEHTATSNRKDVDIAGYAARLRADAAIGPGNLFLEGLYVSGDNDRTAATTTTDAKFKSVVLGSDFAALTSFYVATDMMILLPNADVLNSAAYLNLNPNNGGRGLIHFAGGYSQKFTDKISGKLGVGYLAADKKRKSATGVDGEAKGKAMATEVNANVNYNITKGLDFGVYGAYAFLGSFYDRLSTDVNGHTKNPDDLYDLHARLNFAF